MTDSIKRAFLEHRKESEMSTRKVFLYALGITVVSILLLTFVHGVPTRDQLLGGVTMFVVAFIVMKFIAPGLGDRTG